ncbi:MAG: hypothetical protein J1F22_02310 [Lachnospiraceae bacterium]|nr:hypothetical protein [Lachnospiraceae bacterium]
MAINLNGKKTSLKEDASIYNKHPGDISEKEKLKTMTGKQKRSYFATYYLPPILIGLAVIVVVGYILWSDFINKSDIYLRCAILNEQIADGDLTRMGDEFTEQLGMDAGKKKPSFYVYYTRSDLAAEIGANAASDLSEITSRLVAGVLDCMIADEKDGSSYYDGGFFLNLEDFLTKEDYARLQDSLYIPEQNNPDKAAYGIYLDKSPVYQALFKEKKAFIEKPIFSVISNSGQENKKYAHKLISFFFPESGN